MNNNPFYVDTAPGLQFALQGLSELGDTVAKNKEKQRLLDQQRNFGQAAGELQGIRMAGVDPNAAAPDAQPQQQPMQPVNGQGQGVFPVQAQAQPQPRKTSIGLPIMPDGSINPDFFTADNIQHPHTAQVANAVLSHINQGTDKHDDLTALADRVKGADDSELPSLVAEHIKNGVDAGRDMSAEADVLNMHPTDARNAINSASRLSQARAIQRLYSIDPDRAEKLMNDLHAQDMAAIAEKRQAAIEQHFLTKDQQGQQNADTHAINAETQRMLAANPNLIPIQIYDKATDTVSTKLVDKRSGDVVDPHLSGNQKPSAAAAGGGRAAATTARFMGRVLGAMNEGYASLHSQAGMKNPNSGLFSQSAAGGADGKSIVAGVMSDEGVKQYNASMSGLAPEIAAAQNQGLAPNDSQIHAIESALTISPTDSMQTKQYKLALGARYLRKAGEVARTLATPEQQAMFDDMQTKLKEFPEPDDIISGKWNEGVFNQGDKKYPQDGNAPKAGDVVKGYKFKGGNPADKSNWEKT